MDWLKRKLYRFRLWYMMRNLRRIDNGGYSAWGLLGLVLVVCERSLSAISAAARAEKKFELEDRYSEDFYGIKWFWGIRIYPRFVEREWDGVIDRYWREKSGDTLREPAPVKNMSHDIVSRAREKYGLGVGSADIVGRARRTSGV